MADPSSYAWSATPTLSIPVDGVFSVPTPGFTEPALYETDTAEVVTGPGVLLPGQYVLGWAADFTYVDVTNISGVEWAAGSAIYVTVAEKPEEDPSEAIPALEARIAALEATVAGHETRIAALETMVADHETRIAAMESVEARVSEDLRAGSPKKNR